ncbi:hypothetical protein GPALN_002333 [Globodera pallida]|nr:hypothetical protein GPALN_002333 [Globodera pallida]
MPRLSKLSGTKAKQYVQHFVHDTLMRRQFKGLSFVEVDPRGSLMGVNAGLKGRVHIYASPPSVAPLRYLAYWKLREMQQIKGGKKIDESYPTPLPIPISDSPPSINQSSGSGGADYEFAFQLHSVVYNNYSLAQQQPHKLASDSRVAALVRERLFAQGVFRRIDFLFRAMPISAFFLVGSLLITISFVLIAFPIELGIRKMFCSTTADSKTSAAESIEEESSSEKKCEETPFHH